MADSARANIEITASSGRLASMLGAARSKFAGFLGSVNKGFGKIGQGALGSAIGNTVANIASRGIDLVVNQAVAVRDFEKTLTRFGIAANRGGEFVNGMRTEIRQISRDTAVADSEILAGAQTYVDLTGDVDGARGAMAAFARISQASGSSVADVATATAALTDAMQLDPRDVEAAFSGMIVQGKAGAVGLKDFAGLLSSLAPRFAKFGGSGLLGIGEMGAALQVIRKGFGNAAEAGTGFESLMGSLVANAAKFEKAGVHIFDKDPKTGVKTMRNFTDIIDAIGQSKLMKDPTALIKAFGRKEAMQAFDMLNKNRGLFGDLTKAAEDHSAVERDLGTYMESSAGKLDKAWNGIKISIAEALTPERIAMFVDAVQGLVGALQPVIGAFTSILGSIYDIGAAAGAFVGKHMAHRSAALEDIYAQQTNAGARGRVAETERYNVTVDKIVDSMSGGKVTPAAIQAAMAAKYGVGEKFGRGEGGMGAVAAGTAYLKNVGFQDPAEIIDQVAKQLAAIQGQDMVEQAIKETNRLLIQIGAMTAQGTTVKVGADAVVKAERSAPANTTRPVT